MSSVRPPVARRRWWPYYLGAYVAIWAGYLILAGTMPEDPFAPLRNDLYWPDAETALLQKQPGVVYKVVGHAVITLAVGTVLGFVLVGVEALLRRVTGRTLTRLAGAAYPIAFVWILVVLWVPERITRIDPAERVITVRTIHPLAPWSSTVITLRLDELRGFATRLTKGGFHGKSDVVQLLAVPRTGGATTLAETECDELEGPCLDAADPAVAHLLALLGRTAPATTSEGKDVRSYVLAAPVR